MPPENLFGIAGLTPGGAGIWTLVGMMAGVIVWWIRGMPDRKRADIAGRDSDEAATAAQWARFQNEIDRLLKRINQLENRVDHLETELDEARTREANAVSELTRLRAANAGLGQSRQDASLIVAADRLVEKQRSRP